MTYTLPLPEPDVIVQEPHQCWSAAFASWSAASANVIPAASAITEDEIEAALARYPDVLNDEGGATPAGIALLQRESNVRLEGVRASDMSPAFARAKMRRSGYLYLVYYAYNNSRRLFSHAVVIYGTNARGYMVMDPGTGRGHIDREPTYFNRTEGMLLGTHAMA